MKRIKPTAKMGFHNKFWKVDKHLLPVKAHYLIFFSALACVLPFRTVYAKQLGISATAVGIIFLAIPFMKIVTNPLFGFIVDYFKRFRLTLSLAMVLVAVTHVAMLFVPTLNGPNGFRASNLQIFLKLNCFEDTSYDNDSDSYLQVYSQLKSKETSDLVDVACSINCSSCPSPDENSFQSEPKTTLQSQLVLKRRPCYFEHSFLDESITIVQNGTSRLLKVSGKPFHFVENFNGAHDQNCSRSNYVDSDTKVSGNGDFTLKDTFKSSILRVPDIPPSSRSNDDRIPTTRTHEIFLMGNDDNHGICQWNKWMSCIVKNCSQSLKEVDTAPPDEFLSKTFWLMFVLIAVSSSCFAAVCFLVDTVCYEIVNCKEEYGENRLWGTIGWGLGAFAGGYLNQIITTEDSTTDYSLSFYLLVLLTIIGLIPVSKIKVKNVKYSSNIFKDVCFLFTKPHLVINIFIVYAVGVLSGLIWNYQFWFMEEIGSSQMLLGFSQIFECLFAELPCFLISGWVIGKIGYVNCYSLTFLCFGLRYLFFAYMQDPWMTLPVALLHGPTFGIFFAAMTMYGKTEAPPGTEATVQSVLAVAFEGVGVGTGSILGGIGFDSLGSRKTLFYTSIASFILLALNILLHIFVLRPKKKSPEKIFPAVDVVSHF